MEGNGTGTPVVPPIAMPSVSLRMISNWSVRSSVTRYSVPPSALVMFFAATRIVSSNRLMSVCLESATPMSFNCSRRRNRSAGSLLRSAACMPGVALLDADQAHLMNIGGAEQAADIPPEIQDDLV